MNVSHIVFQHHQGSLVGTYPLMAIPRTTMSDSPNNNSHEQPERKTHPTQAK